MAFGPSLSSRLTASTEGSSPRSMASRMSCITSGKLNRCILSPKESVEQDGEEPSLLGFRVGQEVGTYPLHAFSLVVARGVVLEAFTVQETGTGGAVRGKAFGHAFSKRYSGSLRKTFTVASSAIALS